MKKLQLLALSMLFATSVMMMQASDQSERIEHVKAKIQDGLNSVQVVLQEQLDEVKAKIASSDAPAQLQEVRAKLQAAQAKLQEAGKSVKDAVAKAVQSLPVIAKRKKSNRDQNVGIQKKKCFSGNGFVDCM